ncbi:MAG: putative porin [Woeseiaceae bacterium]|nr:putative porin [Woeseiaceae bacterium]
MSKIAASTAVMALLLVHIPVHAQQGGWTDRLSLKGDVRLRYEGIDEDGEPDRDRMRFRARLGLSADVNDDVKVVVQLATGGDNPVSTNQSFDDGFSTKDIGLDLAYVEWAATDELKIFAGKMKNPLYRAGGAPLIWDGDLNPEGFAAQYTSGNFFGNAGVFSAEERSATADSLLYAAQVGMNFDVGDEGTLTAGVGYFGYTDTVGNEPFFDGDPNGNSVDGAGNYLFDYRNTEIFAQYDARLGEWPLRLYAQLTQNNEVSQEDTGYAFGARLGSAKGQGTSQFSWTYQDIEADAVIGTFNDSDFGGGGTDASGHILKARYMLRDRISLGGTLFINEIDRFQGTEHDYSRIQLDVEFKFD